MVDIFGYHSDLEDTLLGFYLEPFHHSFRKRLSAKPKFYFFDIGVTRALARYLNLSLSPGTSMYGEVFEHFIITECIKLADYYQLDYKFSYLKTAGDLEIDLVVERPGKKLLLIEIKSTKNVTREQVAYLEKFSNEITACECICLSQDPRAKKIGQVMILPWQQGLLKYFMRE